MATSNGKSTIKLQLPRRKTIEKNGNSEKSFVSESKNENPCDSIDVKEDKLEEKMIKTVDVDPDTADPSKAWRRLKKGQRIREVEPQKWSIPLREDCIRFVCMSDTHSRVEKKKFCIPDGDVLLFAGDMTMSGSCQEIEDFNEFIGELPHRDKIVIAGNHDFGLEDEPSPFFDRKNQQIQYGIDATSELLTNCTFIQDELVEVAGIKIYGSPWVPVYGSPAFSLLRGEELLDKWNQIPESTDILITHAPPLGIGDKVPGGLHVGCVELLNTVQHRVRPKYHVFGHIHEGYGMYTDGTTHFINASTCATGYQPTHRPIVFDVQIPEGHNKTDSLKPLGGLESDTLSASSQDPVFDPKKKES